MRFPQPARMADDDHGHDRRHGHTHHSPVWARSKRRRRGGAGGGALIGFIVTLLAAFGALTAVLAIKEGSVAEAGTKIDGWIDVGVAKARTLAGRAPDAARTAADKTGEAARKTGNALESGAEKTADELKRPG